jgi:hypothetical protein
MKWSGHVALMGDARKAYKILKGKSKGKTHLGKPMHRWKNILSRVGGMRD